MPQFAKDTGWLKSPYSGSANENCVEIRFARAGIDVRDSKNPGEGVLRFDSTAWSAFLASISDKR